MKRLLLLLLIPAGLLAWLIARRSAPPETPFSRVTRETLVSTLTTNGKVEPFEWQPVRTLQEGLVSRILARRGDTLGAGQPVIELNTTAAQSELSAAQARVAQAKADLQVLESGGRPADRVELENSIERARSDLKIAQRDLEALSRLEKRQAATSSQVAEARDAVDRLQQQISALERRRQALVAPTDRNSAAARVRELETAAAAAQTSIVNSVVRSPMPGTLYQFDLQLNQFLSAGALVGMVGNLDRMRVLVYVDEPELGRVAAGMPVRITWDALPGREWTGAVERVPTQVTTLSTRQVGEVTCVIENPGHTLLPGTNINAEIRSRVVEKALTIPKEALRRQGNETGVLKLEGDRVVWQRIGTGASSLTRIQVTSGLGASDAVALPVERPLQSGDAVRPVFP